MDNPEWVCVGLGAGYIVLEVLIPVLCGGACGNQSIIGVMGMGMGGGELTAVAAHPPLPPGILFYSLAGALLALLLATLKLVQAGATLVIGRVFAIIDKA